jgi:hypothetical protein
VYRLTINLTYSTTGAATTVRSGLTALLSVHSLLTGLQGGAPTVGGTGTNVTFSAFAPTETVAKQFATDAIPVWSQVARTAGFVTMNKVA